MDDLHPPRRGAPNLAVKVLAGLVAVAMVVLGAIWTFGASGTAQSIGPALAGLGVALAYVALVQKRH